MIPRSHNSASMILLVQFFAIIAGTLVTTAMLKGYGYPDAEQMIWNPVAVFIRNWGWIAILLPALWYGISLRIARLSGGNDLGGWHILIMIGVTVVLVTFYLWTSIHAGYNNVRVTNVDM